MTTEQTLIKTKIEKEFEEKRLKTEKVQPGGRRALGGLCLSCRHSHTCTFPVDETHPVIHCEEFELIRTVSKRTVSAEKSPLHLPREAQPFCHPLFLVLCTICKNRHTCIYAHTEGGIWHCEEYK